MASLPDGSPTYDRAGRRATAATNALDHEADITKVQEWLVRNRGRSTTPTPLPRYFDTILIMWMFCASKSVTGLSSGPGLVTIVVSGSSVPVKITR
jgi:hypothetical protein